MHIPDGILSPGVCIGGYALTGLTIGYVLRQIQRQPDPQAGIPKAALLTATFFVASWIHIPAPPASVHLVLNGLLGVLLGVYAFPAIVIGLFFQAVMFQHGGLSTLGVNAMMMGGTALLAHGLFQLHRFFPRWGRFGLGLFAFLAGFTGLAAAVIIFVTLLVTQMPTYLDASTERSAIYILALSHIPVMLLEGIFTTLVVLFLHRVKPELLPNHVPPVSVTSRPF